LIIDVRLPLRGSGEVQPLAPGLIRGELSQRGRRIADDHLDAPVLLPAGRGIVACHRVGELPAWHPYRGNGTPAAVKNRQAIIDRERQRPEAV